MSRASLLLISNDDALAETLRAALPKGARLDRVRTGSDVVPHLMAAPRALVLVDDPLPDADGLQVLEMIAGAWRDSRVCFVTTRHDPERERAVRRLGAIFYTARPVELATLKRLLHRALAPGA
ncbi:MAG: response regulator [Candidatus Wallbacteria bacterium]|nr:response regulator [Candidatus Wallbacteria bacterium]